MKMNGSRKLPKVITFPPSADCETGRWALKYYAVEFDEHPHAPPFFFLAVFLNKGRNFPLLTGDGLFLNGVRAILDHFNSVASPERKLVPSEYSDQIESLWVTFNKTMGAAVVTWAYTHLLPHREIMIRPLSLGCPAYQQTFVRLFYPIPKTILWKALKLGQPAADEALVKIRATFAQVDEMLADGRKWLIGDRMTLADLAFAASGAPLVLPDGYGGYQHEQGPIPTFEQFPPAQQAVISQMRETAAGKFVLRMYNEERYRPGEP